MTRPQQNSVIEPPGLATRRIAAEILEAVLRNRQPLDEQLSGKMAHAGFLALDDRDRALTRNIVATSLRRLGSIRHILNLFLTKGLPPEAPQLEFALMIGAAQILFLDVPDHAAVDLSVRLVQANKYQAHYAGLANAVLRRIVREGKAALAKADTTTLDTPAWLLQRWSKAYGADTARAIAVANGREAALDLTVKSDPDTWAARLNGQVMPNGTVRLLAQGPVPALPGYDEGQWWVQDAAAALPVHLFGDVSGMTIVDLCAAPGGKTAQLAQAGAKVMAVDRSKVRLARLQDNLQRLNLAADVVVADATAWEGGPFDAVLVDAACSATGTIRRHPDIPWQKQPADIAKLSALQQRLLDNAARITRPGGTIVYCTCSLEPEEGEAAIAAFLERTPAVGRRPITPNDIFGQAAFLTAQGDLRTLPSHWPSADPRMGGLDGFFAARLTKQ
ncbi:MAG: transcription antitermination factor NusB [Pseudorhodoplanes sp.]|jgi:16S rRNA (cytosine967-C5)-methyltransferase|nr:transcription antitermination factor NusB [Pseudorhodoplanes sp.]